MIILYLITYIYIYILLYQKFFYLRFYDQLFTKKRVVSNFHDFFLGIVIITLNIKNFTCSLKNYERKCFFKIV